MSIPANSSDNRAEVKASKQSRGRLNEDLTLSSAQAQTLLTTLRSLIIPLVQIDVPNQKDLHQISLGLEAEDFLIALQKYISSIIRDHSQPDSEIEVKQAVGLEEPPPTLWTTQEEDTPDKNVKGDQEVSYASGRGNKRSVNLEVGNAVIPQILHSSNILPPPMRWVGEDVLDQARTTLRAHFFDIMPIRLLCFKKHDSGLDITLLDRAGIYSHLASKLEDEFKSYPSGEVQLNDALGWIPQNSTYTILSHTWLRSSPGEVTFGDWNKGVFDLMHPGYRKLVDFCRVSAEEHDVTLGWMDTVCIDKESSAELDESIRSMYKWYRNARICIIYLKQTTSNSEIIEDPWFTRGWTLQELLAPRYIAFYSAVWTPLGDGSFNDKEDDNILRQIQSATTITPTELLSPLSKTPISRKMQWAANREVTRGEDSAYSLMGIFDVSISIAYGEGSDRAFTRLVKEILNTAKSEVLDLFNWAGQDDTGFSALIPSSARAYLQRCEFDFGKTRLIEPLTITHLGLRIPVILMPAVPPRAGTPYSPKGNFSSTINIKPIGGDLDALPRSFNILDAAPFDGNFGFHSGDPLELVFAVLNCGGSNDADIHIFKRCFAIAILCVREGGVVTPMGYKRRVQTEEPIVFQLKNEWRSTYRINWEMTRVLKSELEGHGMQSLIMYL